MVAPEGSMPAPAQDDPAPTLPASMTATSSPDCAHSQAMDNPITPPPTKTKSYVFGKLMILVAKLVNVLCIVP